MVTIGVLCCLPLAQAVEYELQEGSLFGITRKDENGNSTRVEGHLSGTCKAVFSWGPDSIGIEIDQIEFSGEPGSLQITGGGRWDVFSIPGPIGNGGAQSGGFILTVDGTKYSVVSPDIQFALGDLPLLVGFFGGDKFGVLLFLAPAPEERSRFFVRGDVDADFDRDIADAMGTLLHLFAGAEEPVCRDAADVNDDGMLDVSDGIQLLNHLFLGGPFPPPPARYCGLDPTEDALDCGGQPACGAISG